MIEKLVSWASYAFFDGSDIGDMLYVWQQAGFFDYILPFLLIFALVFAILSRMKIFDNNKSINGIIALVVGLMSLQFPMVSDFFREIFPRLGVGLAIILVLLILVGLFADPDQKGITYTLLGVGAIIVVVILVQTAGAVGWSSGYWWEENWPMVAGVIFILVIVGIIVGSTSEKPTNADKSILARALRG